MPSDQLYLRKMKLMKERKEQYYQKKYSLDQEIKNLQHKLKSTDRTIENIHLFTKMQSQLSLAVYNQNKLIENHKNEFSFLKLNINADHEMIDLIYSESYYNSKMKAFKKAKNIWKRSVGANHQKC